MRTTHRSTAGTKLLAKRSTKPATRGEFTDIQTHKRSSRADQRVTTVAEATRVLVAKARTWRRFWYSDTPHYADKPLCEAIDNLNAATRAAAKRKRARSVKP